MALLPSWIAGNALQTGQLVRLLPRYEAMFAPGRAFRLGDLPAEAHGRAESSRVHRRFRGAYWHAALLGQGLSLSEGRLLFVNKKKQKNFFMLGMGVVADKARDPA